MRWSSKASLLAAPLVAAALAVAPSPARSAAVDCTAPQGAAATVCADPDLRLMDEALAALHARAAEGARAGVAGAEGARPARRAARRLERRREACGEDSACLAKLYHRALRRLARDGAFAAAAPGANLPPPAAPDPGTADAGTTPDATDADRDTEAARAATAAAWPGTFTNAAGVSVTVSAGNGRRMRLTVSAAGANYTCDGTLRGRVGRRGNLVARNETGRVRLQPAGTGFIIPAGDEAALAAFGLCGAAAPSLTGFYARSAERGT